MPWCVPCDRFLSPATVLADGTCPVCGQAVDPAHAHRPEPTALAAASADGPPLTTTGPTPGATPGAVDAGVVDEDERLPIPWHLWLLLAALAVYLGYRAFQGLEWIFGM